LHQKFQGNFEKLQRIQMNIKRQVCKKLSLLKQKKDWYKLIKTKLQSYV
jgi:hypothetical protein